MKLKSLTLALAVTAHTAAAGNGFMSAADAAAVDTASPLYAAAVGCAMKGLTMIGAIETDLGNNPYAGLAFPMLAGVMVSEWATGHAPRPYNVKNRPDMAPAVAQMQICYDMLQ